MFFEIRGDLTQLRIGLRHDLLEFRDGLRRANAGNDVLALRIHEKFAVERFFAGRGIARKADTGAGVVAHVAEDHSLYICGGADGIRNFFHAAVIDRFGRVPGIEYRVAGERELLVRVLRELAPGLFLHQLLVFADDRTSDLQP